MSEEPTKRQGITHPTSIPALISINNRHRYHHHALPKLNCSPHSPSVNQNNPRLGIGCPFWKNTDGFAAVESEGCCFE
jgi:hypothetical protein